MPDRPEDIPRGERLAASPTELSEFLKSAAHPARIRVLTRLRQGADGFASLMQHTDLSKTALANHLARLTSMGLIHRAQRGRYALTADGRELLNAMSTVYQNSRRRDAKQREALRTRYTKSMVEGRLMNQKTISQAAVYQPCWLSYTGAMAGALTALGVDCDTVDIGGYSGYAFLINVSKGTTCPSGPTALGDAWSRIHKATENLGWTLDHYVGGSPCYPAAEGKPTPDELARAKHLFARVKHEIDARDRPTVLWGLVAPEYGIVTGYKGDAYLTSTFRRLIPQPEDPIPFYDLHAPGGLEAFFFRDTANPNPAYVGRETLENAVCLAEARATPPENYVAGPNALDEWADVLENLPEDEQMYHGNSYVAACVCEGRAIAAEFLTRLATKHPGKHAEHLRAAAASYEESRRLMEEFTRIFPFKFQGNMKTKDRIAAATLLRRVKPLEETAIEHMHRALEMWTRG